MQTSNQRKAETLGMPGGTANNRLRKRIIYNLLEIIEEYGKKFGPIAMSDDDFNGAWEYPGKTRSLFCYRCGWKIDSNEDMTIEHIKPWEGREDGEKLFWDLSNIAFSHRWCNRPHVAVLEPKPLNHGWYGYNKKGCRCDICKEASQQHNLGRYQEGNCRSSTKEV